MKRQKKRRSSTRRAPRKATARRAPRRAPAPAKRRSPRRNPKGFFDQPAVKFGGAALGGALAAGYVNADPTAESPFAFLDGLTMKRTDGTAMFQRSTAAALVTLLVGWFALKGKNRALALAAGVGMLAPQAAAMLKEDDSADRLTTLRASAPPRLTARRYTPTAATGNLRKLNKNLIGA